jgi:hypothetical protein
MARPGKKGSNSNWIMMKGSKFPKNVHLYHKFDQKVVELGFSHREVGELRDANKSWPKDIYLGQKGGVAVLAIDVPFVDMKLDFYSQAPAIEKALAAAHRLLPYATVLPASSPPLPMADAKGTK